MINLRAVSGLVVLAILTVGCATPASPGSSVGPTAGSTPTLAPTIAVTPSAPGTGPAAFHIGPLAAGSYVLTPFTGVGASDVCMLELPTCKEDLTDDSYRVTYTVPDGYVAVSNGRPLIFGPDGDTGLIILRGAGLYSDPCHSTPPPDLAVGPTVDDFANAIAAHPLLDATDPVAVTLAGYSGKFLDLKLPSDVTKCTGSEFWPYEPGMYAQGNDHQWHLWILDVAGIRVVIQSMDYARVSPERRAELQAIVDSIRVDP